MSKNIRSASEATRFTSTTPHASSKHPAQAAAAAKASGSSSAATTGASASMTEAEARARGINMGAARGSGPGARRGGAGIAGETPEERVRRLRAAHEAAKKAQVSQVDKVVGGGRRMFDVAHRLTVAGILGFTAIAGLVSIYSVYDMVTYNRRRRDDFAEAQKRIETDSLASARLAFINGTATEEQIELVEEANEAARKSGFKLPPLLSPSAPSTTTPSSQSESAESSTPVLDAVQREALLQQAEREQGTASGGSSWWPFSSSSGSAAPSTLDNAKQTVQNEARAAFEKEKQNQKQGGMLDQVGNKPEEKKKGWW